MDLARLIRGGGLDQEELVRVVDAVGPLEEEVALVAGRLGELLGKCEPLIAAVGRIVNPTTMKIIDESFAFGRLPAAGAEGAWDSRPCQLLIGEHT